MNKPVVHTAVVLAAILCAGPATGAFAADGDLLSLRERLVGTVWALQLKPMFGEPLPEPLTDTVSFTGGQLLSDLFADQGFSAAEFTVTIEPGDIQVWEATQLNPEDGIVLWKGELEGRTVRGIVSRHPLQGITQDFIFTGEEVIPEPVVPAEPAVPSAQPELPAAVIEPEVPQAPALEIQPAAPLTTPEEEFQPFSPPDFDEPEEVQPNEPVATP